MHFQVSIVHNWRETLGHQHFFGNGPFGLTVSADTAGDVPKALRVAVQQLRDPACLRWFIGQGEGKSSDLMVDNWGRFLTFERVSFASGLQDVNLCTSMMAENCEVFAPLALRFIMIVPQPDGIKSFVMGNADLVGKLCRG